MSADMSDDEGGPLSAHDWHPTGLSGSPADSVKSDTEMDDKPTTVETSSVPVQKRRRVTRACDECRRKKIKCDGKQPCTHCSVYSYDCTYDKPSNRRRNPAPQYIEALEGRLQRAEALLQKFMSNIDLADPNLDPVIQQEFTNRQRVRAAQSAKLAEANANLATTSPVQEPTLTSMIDALGQLDLEPKEGWEFHGTSSGAVFLTKMKDHFNGMMAPSYRAPFLPRQDRPAGLVDLDVAPLSGSSMFSSCSDLPGLPPIDVGRKLCYYSLSCATCLLRIVHIGSFKEKLEKIYNKPVENMNHDEKRFLGLVYAVLALGCMYIGMDENTKGEKAYQEATMDGMKYFQASRMLNQDMTQCKELTSLQALLFMILFLQATTNLSTCYTYIGIALRSALRMGLHRHIQHEQLGTLEQENRSRVFYVIRQMDIYVSTLLGYPIMLNKDDIDQAYPTEVNDEYLSVRGIVHPPSGTPSFFQAFNSHTRLMEILVKVVKNVYPMRGAEHSMSLNEKTSPAYQIPYYRIKEIEGDLQQWFEKLPEFWRPSPAGPDEVTRVRHLLRFAYAHVQLVLYRPFLHYFSPHLAQKIKTDEISYACAAAAISVSRNIIHIGLEIRKQQVLSGPYWFMLHTELFAVLSLVYYCLQNPDKPGASEVLQDACAGRQMIEDLATKSQTADRVSKTLKDLFDQLPESLEQVKKPTAPTKKKGTSQQKSATASHSVIQQNITPSRTSTFGRSRTGNFVANMFGRSNSRTPISTPVQPEQSYREPSFPTRMEEYLPTDLSSRATPESASTHGSSAQGFSSQLFSSQNPMDKVDSIMFSSDDPFAYPNQPMMELGFKVDDGQMAMANEIPDASLFMNSGMDEMNQILEQPPPYMMQPQNNPVMQMNPNMYDAHFMMGMQNGDPQPQQMPTPPQPQPTMTSQRRARATRNQERQIDQMFTNQGMQPDWGSFFGSGRGAFQGL